MLRKVNFMNIWHDIDKERVTPNDFLAVIEISKGSKSKYELDKKTGVLYSTEYCIHRHIIPQTTDLSPRRLQTTEIRLMCLFCATSLLFRLCLYSAILSVL